MAGDFLMCRSLALKSGLVVCMSDHAKERISEMRVDPRAVAATLNSPEAVYVSPKYVATNRRNLSRGELTLVVEPCGRHLRVLTALPRTQEKWHELDRAGLLGPRGALRSVDHLPTRADLASRRNPLTPVRPRGLTP